MSMKASNDPGEHLRLLGDLLDSRVDKGIATPSSTLVREDDVATNSRIAAACGAGIIWIVRMAARTRSARDGSRMSPSPSGDDQPVYCLDEFLDLKRLRNECIRPRFQQAIDLILLNHA